MSYRSLSAQESQLLKKDDEAPKTETWKQIKECGMTVLCLYDFISDIFASQANAHSEHKELHFLGYFGAGLLLASGVANIVMVTVIRRSHLEAFQELSKRMPFQWHLFRLLSSTSPEILNSFFAIAKASSSTIPLSTSIELEVAAGTVKRFGLLAQLFEDIPQFTVQAMSVYLCLQHGWALSAGVLASLAGTLAMVLFKTITNFLALALKCQVSQVVLAEAAEEENRRVKLFPDWTRACQVSVQALMTIFNLLFLLNSGPIYFGHLDGRTIGYISLFISYALAIALSLLLVLQCRDRLWHMLSDLDRSAALLSIASLHPCTLLLAEPCLPKLAPCLWNVLFIPPLLRNITVGSLSLWAIWQDSSFPVPENFCILLLVLNSLAIFQLIFFVEETEVEEVTEVSSITSLEHREIENKVETRKLDELFGNLKKAKLADWPRLLEHCPASFEKHKGISMAMELWKAVDQRKSEAAADAATLILASGQNFETLVIQDLQRLQEVASFIKDAGAEEITEASDILTLEKPEIQKKVETRKLEELLGNLKKSKLADWPRLLEHCPRSFEKHKGISMAMDFEKAIKQKNSAAAADAAKRILASGQNFETLVIQELELFLESMESMERWTRGAERSSKRSGSAAAVLGDRIYVIGGYDGSNQLKSMEWFDTNTQTWTRGAGMSSKRSGCAAAALGDKIYVIGGHDGSVRLNSMEWFDKNTQKWTRGAEMSSKRSGCAAVVFGDKIYVMGGEDGKRNDLKSMEWFDPKTQKWTRGAEMSSKRSGCAAAVLGDKIYVIGGYDGSNQLKSMEWFDPESQKWTAAPEMSSKRDGCAAAVLGDKIYVIGGYDGSSYLKSMESFDPKTQKWTRGAEMSSKRSLCAAAVCGDKVYVMGGYDGSDRLKSMERLLPFDAVLKMWGLS